MGRLSQSSGIIVGRPLFEKGFFSKKMESIVPRQLGRTSCAHGSAPALWVKQNTSGKSGGSIRFCVKEARTAE
jgi:hypothetical protein